MLLRSHRCRSSSPRSTPSRCSSRSRSGPCTRRAEGGGPLAGALAGLAAVTRVPGVLLVVPLALIYLKQHRRQAGGSGGSLLAPAALGGLPRLSRGQGLRGVGAARQQTGAQHQHRMAGPIETILAAVRRAWAGLRTLDEDDLSADARRAAPVGRGEHLARWPCSWSRCIVLVAAFRRLPLAYGAYAVRRPARVHLEPRGRAAAQVGGSIHADDLSVVDGRRRVDLGAPADARDAARRARCCSRSGRSSSRRGRGSHERAFPAVRWSGIGLDVQSEATRPSNLGWTASTRRG